MTTMHVVVIVLGDLGRSPRMQYHTLSLLQEGYHVTLVGYEGEELIPSLDLSNFPDTFSLVRFPNSAPEYLRSILPLYFAFRLFSLIIRLIQALCFRVRKPVDCVLIQNPPAIPLLLASYLYCQWISFFSTFSSLYSRQKRPKLVVDWHNLGFTMFRPGKIRSLAKLYETSLAPWVADGNLCVTQAMRDYLRETLHIRKPIEVLYDAPPTIFQPRSIEERHIFLQRLEAVLPKDTYFSSHTSPSTTLLTTEKEEEGKAGNHIKILPRKFRPFLITSSTSWTEDEDFGILLDALVILDQQLDMRRVVVLVTGKGPMKEFYELKISKLRLSSVSIHTLWLSPSDYPLLLSCADVGISLHKSTSGLDLPMKILDLYGCGTPVCALDFSCIHELVQDQINGRLFRTPEELAEQLLHFCQSFPEQAEPHSFGVLATYSSNLKGRARWSENWKSCALPLILQLQQS
jgi:beta-1,4-mannosyltransferase